jgi:hypothetical protein
LYLFTRPYDRNKEKQLNRMATSDITEIADHVGIVDSSPVLDTTDREDYEDDTEARLAREMEEIERQIQARRADLERIARENERKLRQREMERQLAERRAMLERLTAEIESGHVSTSDAEIRAASMSATSSSASAAASMVSSASSAPIRTVESLLATVESAIRMDDERRLFENASDWMFAASGVRFKYEDMTPEVRHAFVGRYRQAVGPAEVEAALRRSGGGVATSLVAPTPSSSTSASSSGSSMVVTTATPPGAETMNDALRKGYVKDPHQILSWSKGTFGAPSADLPVHFSKLKGVMARSTADFRK